MLSSKRTGDVQARTHTICVCSLHLPDAVLNYASSCLLRARRRRRLSCTIS
jgi:hypothetical protein